MNQWEEEDRRRQGEMFTLVHLRQGANSIQIIWISARPRWLPFDPARAKTRRAQALAGQKCTQELRVVPQCTQELRVVRTGLEESCARLAGKGWPQLARTAERVREALRGLGGCPC